jgi:hypothetical protein
MIGLATARGALGLALRVAVLVLAGAGVAPAHTGGSTGFAAIGVSGNGVRYSVTLSASSLPAPVIETLLRAREGQADARQTLLRLVRDTVRFVADGTPCAPGQGDVLFPAGDAENVTVVVHFACAGPIRDLALRDDTFDVLGPDHHTLAKLEAGATVHQLAFEPNARTARVTISEQGVAGEGGTSFFVLGVRHILGGWDHLLFLLALLLRGGTVFALLKIVTAFTLAHSVTLALAVLDVVSVPERLVESVIALSIAVVAAENLLPRRALSARWPVSFAFGLVHGFGFATALRELAVPRGGLAGSLLGFNLGVEAGQALVVAVVMPLLLLLGRAPAAPVLVRAGSVAILVVGGVLFVERLFVS